MKQGELNEMSWALNANYNELSDTYWALAKKLQEAKYKRGAQRSDMSRLSDLNIALEAIIAAQFAVNAIREGAEE
jgi:hypothetical protein